jgi:hypothetical protein
MQFLGPQTGTHVGAIWYENEPVLPGLSDDCDFLPSSNKIQIQNIMAGYDLTVRLWTWSWIFPTPRLDRLTVIRETVRLRRTVRRKVVHNHLPSGRTDFTRRTV